MYASIHIAQSLQPALNSLLGFIPNLIGFAIILIVGFLIARKLMGDAPTGKVIGTVPVGPAARRRDA